MRIRPIPNNMSPGPFFGWRRLLAAANFASGVPSDIALMNWPRQDYAAESILNRTPEDSAQILQRAKRTSLAFLYWLQNDVPRDDGKGAGYPELKLRPDQMGTADGLSKMPYIQNRSVSLPAAASWTGYRRPISTRTPRQTVSRFHRHWLLYGGHSSLRSE